MASVVVVTGPAGAGKSTEAARLALALNKRTAWLDAEQNAERTRDVWRRAGGQDAELLSGKFKRVPEEDGWQGACREASRARVVVVDSLDEWTLTVSETGGELARRAVLKQARTWAAGGRIVIVICHYARKGHLKGTTTADHGGDGTIHVEQDRIWQQKCRWAPPGEVARAYAAAAGVGAGAGAGERRSPHRT